MNYGEFFLLNLFLEEIEKAGKDNIKPFPLVYYRLGSIFHLDRTKSKTVLRILESRGLIEVIPFHGVKIKTGASPVNA